MEVMMIFITIFSVSFDVVKTKDFIVDMQGENGMLKIADDVSDHLHVCLLVYMQYWYSLHG